MTLSVLGKGYRIEVNGHVFIYGKKEVLFVEVATLFFFNIQNYSGSLHMC